MEYDNVKKATFLHRPNRFIAEIMIDGKKDICHVKNTGRCQELLVENADIYVREVGNTNRKTHYDLISVVKGNRLINMDSQAPNKVFYEWLIQEDVSGDIANVRPEFTLNGSRFDFLVETKNKRNLVEVKGVTLEKDGVTLFPDAPTERGIKHIHGLVDSMRNGYTPFMVFVIQMKDVLMFKPNIETHPAFGQALQQAVQNGLQVLAVDCLVTPTGIWTKDRVNVVL